MIEPNYKFSDGTETDCIDEAKNKVNELLNDYRDFSVSVDEKEVRFVNIGGCEDV